MTKTMSLLNILILTLLFATVAFGSNADLLFEAGNRAYLDGDMTEARTKWKQIEDLGFSSGALYYNLGNAYYKTGELGEAILYWEKAANLLGEDNDIATNLQIARAQIDDKLDESVRLPVWDWFDQVRDRFSARFLTTLAVLFSFVTFGALAGRRWLLPSEKVGGKLKPVAVVFALLLMFSLGLIWLKAREETVGRMAVFLVPETEVLSAPAIGSGKLLFTLHEGTTVRVVRVLEGWIEVTAGKDKQGWVRSDALGLI